MKRFLGFVLGLTTVAFGANALACPEEMGGCWCSVVGHPSNAGSATLALAAAAAIAVIARRWTRR